jgi:hypothetical protein
LKILFKLASRSRPDKFFACIDNIIQNATTTNYTILCSLDNNDAEMPKELVYERLRNYPGCILPVYGNSKNKVHAINRDIEKVDDFDILVNTSDDMWFVQKGFDQTIIEDGVLHYSDGNYKCNSLMTMSIIGKPYYDRFGYIYNPDYISLWCDNEATEVAQNLKKYKYMGDNKILFNHNHPKHNTKFKEDDLLRYTDSFYWKDKKTFERRKHHNFFLPELKRVA